MDQLKRYLLIIAAMLMVNISVFAQDVFVTNTPTTPVPTRDVDNPARIAVADECDFILPDGIISSGDVARANPCLISVVPTGKQLVIEFITALVNLPQKQVPTLIVLAGAQHMGGGSGQPNFQIALPVGPRTVGTRDNYLATHMVRIYDSPGNFLTIVGGRTSSSGEAHFVVSWSGYLVDVP
jgi:hypothetical protein